ncbi:MAG: tetratricopeptide repeat protein [Betaproteobacteria bacterium]
MLRCLAILCLAGCGFAAQAGPATDLLAQADKHWAEGRLEPAQKAFEAAVAAEPAATEPRLRLAGFQLSRQQMAAAIANYQRVLGTEPKNAKAWMGMGLAYLHTGKQDLALAAFDEAMRYEPRYVEKVKPLVAKLKAPS